MRTHVAIWTALALLWLASVPARAGQFTITNATGTALDFGTVALTGTQQTKTATTVPTWLIDTQGSNTSWSVTLQASNFTSGGSTLLASNLRYTAVNGQLIVIRGDAIDPTYGPKETGFSGTLDLPVKSLTCTFNNVKPSTGNLELNWIPSGGQFLLTVPASAMAGTYTATLTATLTTTP